MVHSKNRCVILSGLSGAGHSVALNALEDVGFHCIDNLPVEIFDSFVQEVVIPNKLAKSFAVGMDIRDPAFITQFSKIQQTLKSHIKTDTVFLVASPEVIADRYSTSRRKHPLLDQTGELLACIRRERAMLSEVEAASDVVMDTSELSPHQLSRMLLERYAQEGVNRKLHVNIFSFGFKYGVPRAVDCVYDVRFLPNPYFAKSMREKSGLDQEVREFIFNNEKTTMFAQELLRMNQFLVPQYYQEGKMYLRIGIGCTGGQHRSVAIAEWLAESLSKNISDTNIHFSVQHRDLVLEKL